MKKGELYKEGTPSEVINYQTIEETYETVVITIENPVNGKPALFPVPERYRLT
jgi:iron complex transport system ATP-binding protein